MFTTRRVNLIVIALAVVHLLLSAQGKEITLLLNDGRELDGLELISVRDSALIVSMVRTVKDAIDTAALKLVKTKEIQEVMVKGESRILSGMGVGFAVGGGVGALIGLASGDDSRGFFRWSAGEKALIVGSTLGAVGILVGLATGAASSAPDRAISPLPEGDLSVLKPYARYPHFEPTFLNEVR